MKNVTMDNPLTTQEIYDELFNFKESLKQLAGDFGELANGIMLSLAKKPSADRPKGEWIESREQNILMAKRIEKGETWRVCSNCGTGYMIGAQYEGQKSYGKRFHNFCPRCGADMRGETDEL